MPRTVTKTVYEFHELSERAQQRVKEWLNESGGPEDFDFVIEDFKIVAAMFGFEVRVTGDKGQHDSIYWQTYPSSAGFCADWAFPERSPTEALKAHMGDEDALYQDAERFEAALARFRLEHDAAVAAGNLTARITGTEHGLRNIEYYDPINFTNEGGREFTEAEHEEMVDDYMDLYEQVEQIARDLGHWLAKNIEAEHNSHWEDEYVRETCEANEYLFDEDGCIVR